MGGHTLWVKLWATILCWCQCTGGRCGWWEEALTDVVVGELGGLEEGDLEALM